MLGLICSNGILLMLVPSCYLLCLLFRHLSAYLQHISVHIFVAAPLSSIGPTQQVSAFRSAVSVSEMMLVGRSFDLEEVNYQRTTHWLGSASPDYRSFQPWGTMDDYSTERLLITVPIPSLCLSISSGNLWTSTCTSVIWEVGLIFYCIPFGNSSQLSFTEAWKVMITVAIGSEIWFLSPTSKAFSWESLL